MNLWHSPWAFGLIPLVVGLLIWNFLKRQQKKASLQFSGISELKKIKPGIRARWIHLPVWIKGFAMIIAIVALARPQRSDELVRKNVEGIDIVITLDISDSMVIEDMEPYENRLESAKATIHSFVKGRVADRIGLVLFMGESFTKIPPTLDYDMILNELKTIEPSRSIKMGTAIGVALANAVARLKESTAKTRVIVFLTDGENNSGTIDPETALEIAKGYNIKIYTIGIGKDGETKLPIIMTDPFGNKVKRYQPFSSTVNEQLLKKMADETGGKYYRATSGLKLDEVFSEIDKLEKTKLDVNKFTKYTENFFPWLLASLLIYLFGIILENSILRRAP